MDSIIQKIDAIISYYSNNKDLLQSQYNEKISENNTLIHISLVNFGTIISLIAVFSSIMLPYTLNTYTQFAQTAEQNNGYLIQLSDRENSPIKDALINSSAKNIENSIAGIAASQKLVQAIIKTCGIMLVVSFMVTILILVIGFYILNKKKNQLTDSINDTLNVIHCLYVLKIRYSHRLKLKKVEETVNLFFIDSKEYLARLRQLIDLLQHERAIQSA